MTLPHDIDAEVGLLGAALIDGSLAAMIDITADDFYIVKHKWIWEALQELALGGAGVDLVTLTDRLERDNKLGEAGGPAYMAELLSNAVTSLYAQDYAEIIRDMSTRRSMLLLAQDIAKAAQNKSTRIDTGEFIDRLVSSGRVTGGAVHWAEYWHELYKEIGERFENPIENWGIPTGFPDFDKITGGLQPGESMILSGKPGIGKSMLAVQFGEQMAKHAPGAIYSLEMTGKAVLRRTLSANTEIKSRQLKTGRLDADDWKDIVGAIERLSQLPVYMSDNPNWTTTSLRADLSRLKLQHGIQWFVFDYMTLCNEPDREKEHERIGAISRGMKLISRHLDLAGILIHSMTKSGIDSVIPGMTALRGEAGVPYDADIITFLVDFQPIGDIDESIPKADKEKMKTLIFGKGRELENPRKYIHFVKSPDYPHFGEYAKEIPNGIYRG